MFPVQSVCSGLIEINALNFQFVVVGKDLPHRKVYYQKKKPLAFPGVWSTQL